MNRKLLPPVPMNQWGHDHWSNLAYIETVCVDRRGKPELSRMNCNPKRYSDKVSNVPRAPWDDAWSSRLKGHTESTPVQIKGHCDWDCVRDIEAAGLVTVSDRDDIFSLTQLGHAVVALLRAHKCRGGKFSNFDPLKPYDCIRP